MLEIKKARLTRHPVYKFIPVCQLKINNENKDFFNEEVKKCIDNKYNKIVRTFNGGISKKTRYPAYDVRRTTSCVELTVIDMSGMYRIQFRNSGEKKDEKALSGSKSFKLFKALCEKHGVDLKKYEIENGKEVKAQIETYIIKLERESFKNKTFTAHHIDFHSSFPSGLVNTHEEFRPVIEELYNGRKEHPEYKLVLNSTIGYMQSLQCCKAKYAVLSRDAIKNNNDRLRAISERLKASGRVVLAYNTDGIWYSGDLYHDENEGTTIGTWANDHVSCKVRFKSAGSYEFIEDGKYYPVVRGHTRLDDIKDREHWEWGDIYKIEATPIKYFLDDDDLIYNV